MKFLYFLMFEALDRIRKHHLSAYSAQRVFSNSVHFSVYYLAICYCGKIFLQSNGETILNFLTPLLQAYYKKYKLLVILLHMFYHWKCRKELRHKKN